MLVAGNGPRNHGKLARILGKFILNLYRGERRSRKIQKIENEKTKKYNPDDIFKCKQNNSNDIILRGQEEKIEMIDYKEQKWYKKLFAKILKIFRKKWDNFIIQYLTYIRS